MPPRRRAPTPIPIDVEAVRRKLDEGKIVRVGISRSAQFPDGGVGRVRRVGDPAVDGEEFIQVELSLNGTKDTLPFTPADLTPATRGTPPAVAAVAPRSTQPRVGATKAPTPPARRTTPSSPVQQADSLFADTGAAALPPATAAMENVVNPSTPPQDGAAPAVFTPPVATKPKATRGGVKRSPMVAISIATTDTEPPQWRIEAKVGARVVLRSGSVAPARVWELVGMLDDPTLIKAVGAILDDQRKAAQARADALAAELAQVRAELEALPAAKS